MFNMFEFIKAVYRLLVGTTKYAYLQRTKKIGHLSDRPTVILSEGKVRGISVNLPNGKQYHSFQGIPYARAPVGKLRFAPPVPVDKFDPEEVDCARECEPCTQVDLYFRWRIIGVEGQLCLNVYTPTLPSDKNTNPQLPVMVYIHGGGFESGSGSTFLHDPIHLLQEDVIVVLMNYRLGPLGFLSFPEMGIAGNAGLKDQLLAFKWVKRNIIRFGGDPNNVTLFGQSAGSWSVYLHYLSPNSRQYFNRAICQSGVVCTESFFQVEPSTKARKLAKALGYRGDSDLGVLDTLMTAPAHLIMKHQRKMASDQERKLAMNYVFRPVIEKVKTTDSIITKTPGDILKDFDSIRMPLITGCNTGEGCLSLYFMEHNGQIGVFDEEVERLVPCFLKENPKLDYRAVGGQIKRFYFGEQRFTKRTKQQMCDLMSDCTFITPAMINVELLARYQPNVRHYHYRFTFSGRFNLFKGLFNQSAMEGPSHGDDSFYIFDSPLLPSVSPGSKEFKVRNNFIRLWTNFAKYGYPTPSEPVTAEVWPEVRFVGPDADKVNLDCLQIDTETSVIRNPSEHRTVFWRNLLQKYKEELC